MSAERSAAYRGLFEDDIAVYETREPGDAAALLPGEAAFSSRAVDKRVREFAAGRVCARRALADLGMADFPLRAAADRQPLWPPDVIGSITHTDGFCAAAATERGRLIGIGIDTEVVATVSAAMQEHICGEAETRWIRSLPPVMQDAATMLIFSAKEAFYKCQYPVVGEWLNFTAVEILLDEWRHDAGGGLRIRPLQDLAIADRVKPPFKGRYLFHERYVSVAVTLPVRPAAQ